MDSEHASGFMEVLSLTSIRAGSDSSRINIIHESAKHHMRTKAQCWAATRYVQRSYWHPSALSDGEKCIPELLLPKEEAELGGRRNKTQANGNILGQHACDPLGLTFSTPLLRAAHALQTHLRVQQRRLRISPLPSLHHNLVLT